MRRLVTGHISMYPVFDLCHNSPGYCKNFLEKAEGILFFGLHHHLLFSFVSTVHIHNDSAERDGETTLRQVFQKVYSAKMLQFTQKKTQQIVLTTRSAWCCLYVLVQHMHLLYPSSSWCGHSAQKSVSAGLITSSWWHTVIRVMQQQILCKTFEAAGLRDGVWW